FSNLDVVIFNGGLFRQNIAKGDVRLSDAYSTIPFNNTLVMLNVTGRELREIIEHGKNIAYAKSSCQFYGIEFDIQKNIQNNSIRLLNGKELQDNEKYRIGVSSFMLPNGDGYPLYNATEILDTQITLRDLLIEAIKQKN
ncbi:MAG: 5'-nucleotidase, partial [Proteobacteria bacterium]|nr:5'-nucleotidase [Pseudomonadota bacterium]